MSMLKKYQSPAAFSLIIVCFILPFLDVRCNDVPVRTLSGFQLATGTTIKLRNDTLSKDESKDFDLNLTEQHVDPNYFVLIALVLAVAGVMLSLLLPKAPELLMGLIGFAGLLCLLLTRINLNHSIENDAGRYEQYILSLKYLYGYWLAVILFTFAGGYNFLHYIDERQEELRAEDKQSGSSP